MFGFGSVKFMTPEGVFVAQPAIKKIKTKTRKQTINTNKTHGFKHRCSAKPLAKRDKRVFACWFCIWSGRACSQTAATCSHCWGGDWGQLCVFSYWLWDHKQLSRRWATIEGLQMIWQKQEQNIFTWERGSSMKITALPTKIRDALIMVSGVRSPITITGGRISWYRSGSSIETSQMHVSVSRTDFNLHFKSLRTWFQFCFCYFAVIIAAMDYRSLMLRVPPHPAATVVAEFSKSELLLYLWY